MENTASQETAQPTAGSTRYNRGQIQYPKMFTLFMLYHLKISDMVYSGHPVSFTKLVL